MKLKTLTKQNLLNGRSLDSLLSSEIEFMETIVLIFHGKLLPSFKCYLGRKIKNNKAMQHSNDKSLLINFVITAN